MKIAIVGASGFIGSALTTRLLADTEHELVLFSHRASTLSFTIDDEKRLTHLDGTVLDAAAITAALQGCDMAIYLVHMMGEKSLHAQFIDAEHQGAENFATAVATHKIRRVIYVGGMGEASADLTQHLRSRLETGKVIRSKVKQLIEFKTPMVIGSGGAGYEALKAIVHKSPLFPLPRWARATTQPITLGDVVRYIVAAIDSPVRNHVTVPIGGPERLSYSQIAKRIAAYDGKHLIVIRVPLVSKAVALFCLRRLLPTNYAAVLSDMIGSAGYSTPQLGNTAYDLFPRIVPEQIDIVL